MREVAWARLQGPVTSVLQYTLVSRVGPGCSAALCTPEHTPLELFLLYLYQLFKLVVVCHIVNTVCVFLIYRTGGFLVLIYTRRLCLRVGNRTERSAVPGTLGYVVCAARCVRGGALAL